MEYCRYVWAGAPGCYLEMLDKLPKRICRAVGPSFVDSLEPLGHCQNVASIGLFYRYITLVDACSSKVGQVVPFPYSRGSSSRHFDRLHDFSDTILRYYKDVYLNSFLYAQLDSGIICINNAFL